MPLPQGATFTFPVKLADHASPEARLWKIDLAAGKYTLSAQYKGIAVPQRDANHLRSKRPCHGADRVPGIEKRSARYPQFFSRVGLVHEFRSLADADVPDLLEQRWVPTSTHLPAMVPSRR